MSVEDWIRNRLAALVFATELGDKNEVDKISYEIVRSYCIASEAANLKIKKIGAGK